MPSPLVIAVTDLSRPMPQSGATEINKRLRSAPRETPKMTKFLTAAFAAATLAIVVLSATTTSAEAFPRSFFGHNLSGTDLGSGR